jgi:hypothetical protein
MASSGTRRSQHGACQKARAQILGTDSTAKEKIPYTPPRVALAVFTGFEITIAGFGLLTGFDRLVLDFNVAIVLTAVGALRALRSGHDYDGRTRYRKYERARMDAESDEVFGI